MTTVLFEYSSIEKRGKTIGKEYSENSEKKKKNVLEHSIVLLFKSSKFGVHHTTKTQELTTQTLRWHELSWSCDQILCKKKKEL